MEQMEEVVAADQAIGNRRLAAKVGRRRRAGGGASEVADDDDTPGAGEGSNNGAADDDNRAQAEEEDPDERYMNRAWFPQMLCSAFLMLAKARHYFTHPPAWLSRARREAGGEHHQQQLQAAARLYESLSALALVVEAAILIQLCLFRLELVSAGRARAALRGFMAVSSVTLLAAFAVTISVVGSAEAAAVFLMALLNAPVAVKFALEKLKEVLAEVGELFPED